MAKLGVLNGQIAHISTDAAAGFTLVEIEIGWNGWEPSNGSFDAGYKALALSTVQQYKAAGYQVIISAGLFSPAAWVLGLGQYVDQFGASSGSPNWNSSTVLAVAQTYLNDLVSTLGTNVNAYRIGLSPSGEMGYPSTNTNQWWAFDTTAQASCPMPGWIPGTATYLGNAVTPTQATAWYQWYLGLLNTAHAWEVTAHRSAGWAGSVTYNINGVGFTPTLYDAAMNAILAQNVFWTPVANIGVAWDKVISTLPLSNAVVNCTSMYDGSGVPLNNASASGDSSVSLASADPTVSHWSAARWIAYLARAAGFTSIICESVGNDPNQMASQVAGTMAQAFGCGVDAILWANDISMYDGIHATPAQVAAGFNAAFGVPNVLIPANLAVQRFGAAY